MDSLARLLRFHLKYCERCGSLWLRPDGAGTPYCRRCAGFMAALPLHRPRKARKPPVSVCAPPAIALLVCLLSLSLEVFGGVCA